ncbi:MAG TPA: gluconate 2-dehydrogenase subunit 3 family protein [Vicinamibacterales bacterium]|nr:gluconate 2-dehydrogenase subunit 3 family protein [Vicinamibacterales bacterium]
MTPELEPSHASTISRREAIRRAALLAGVALSPEWLTFVGRAQTPATTSYLTAAQGAIASAAADRILPRTDTPGAVDVGVPAFIDRFYGEFMSRDEQQLLVKGLEEIEAAAKAANGASFSTLTAAQQDAVLRSVATAQQGRDPGSFALLRSATVLGYFTSEQVGKNVLHYDPVPGSYDGCVPIDQVGRRNWTT